MTSRRSFFAMLFAPLLARFWPKHDLSDWTVTIETGPAMYSPRMDEINAHLNAIEALERFLGDIEADRDLHPIDRTRVLAYVEERISVSRAALLELEA